MPQPLMPAFRSFPKEAAIVGRLLAGYGELELQLCSCVGVAIKDTDAAFKAMFRPRGESQRIEIADALARKSYDEKKLGAEFSDAIGAVRFCLTLRNQYAHCHWDYKEEVALWFLEMEELAKKNKIVNFKKFTYRKVTADFLKKQEKYFVYTMKCLQHLEMEWLKLENKLSNHPYPMPKKVKRPLRYMP